MTALHDQLAVPSDRLRRQVDVTDLTFVSTAEVPPLQGTIGQPRGLDAIAFAVEASVPGYHLFVSGRPGSGRESIVREYLERYAPTRPSPPDWVYVHNFDKPDEPVAFSLPPAMGRQFAQDMDELTRTVKRDIPLAFDSEDYHRRLDAIRSSLEAHQSAVAEEMQRFAQERGFAIVMAAGQVGAVPAPAGKPLNDEEFLKLPEAERLALEQKHDEVRTAVASALRRAQQLEKDAAEQVEKLHADVVEFVLRAPLETLRQRYNAQPDVLAHLDRVRSYLLLRHDDLIEHEDSERKGTGLLMYQSSDTTLSKLGVNVVVDHALDAGAPVVFERNPSYYTLVGRVDYTSTFGAMITDFQQIKGGALHRANGGFLMLHALDLLVEPVVWSALKQALLTCEVRIENLGAQRSAVPTSTLRPMPIPLNVKVILIGPPEIYSLLYHSDEDFQELFQVKAEFAPDMDWTAAHEREYAAFVSRRVRERGLRHFDADAVARLVEYGGRLRESQRKLTTRLLDIDRIVTEASLLAERAGHPTVTGQDVAEAIAKKAYRSNMMQERLYEEIANGTIMIETDGWRVGQVNGLTILDVGDYVFGAPTRITARAGLGAGAIQSIEREIELSGPIHSKGVLTLSGYLTAEYARDWPLALSATLTFEQSYDEVEGDSASAAELYALLSTLADVPLDQGIAVTGSVDQRGEIQAVGGVTRKIEGFFAICTARGLTGRQGVMIPAANLPHLMLADDVVEAVRTGQFHVWAVHTVDEGIELLTGHPAGERRKDGTYPDGTVHQRVAEQLQRLAITALAYADGLNGHRRRLSRARTRPAAS